MARLEMGNMASAAKWLAESPLPVHNAAAID